MLIALPLAVRNEVAEYILTKEKYLSDYVEFHGIDTTEQFLGMNIALDKDADFALDPSYNAQVYGQSLRAFSKDEIKDICREILRERYLEI